MAEQQPSRQLSDLPSSATPKKPDSQLRLVGADGQIVFPDQAKPTDDAATIISKNKPKPNVDAIMPAEMLASKSLRGQRLSHFELIEPIGVGGMAAVIRARDMQLDRFVALKILPPEMANDHENVRRFHQEAKAAAKLDHPNIARVFFCGEDRDLHFIAFEYVEGDNLRVVLEKRGKLPVAEAVRYILQIATGLEHAASRGVVHRDIKPSNIIITPTGQAKLVDMGLARNAETHSDQALTQSGVTLGTFDYISPEQALEPREADVRSDIYSLGCTFYHMLTGQAPVPEGTAAKKLYHHQHLAPIDPRQLNRDIPDAIAAILMRMMAKDPAQRYQRPVHLVQHLMQVAQQVGAGSDAPEGVMFLDAPLPGAPRFRPIVTVSVAALALGILLMLVSLGPSNRTTNFSPPPKDPPPEFKGPNFKEGTGSGSFAKVTPAESIITTREKLVQSLDDPKRNKVLLVEGTIDLENLHLHGEKKPLTLRAEKAATLRFRYEPIAAAAGQEAPGTLAAGLIIEGDDAVTFENIRFELTAKAGSTNPVAMAAVLGAGKVTFRKCTFVQNVVSAFDKSGADVPLASVFLDNSGLVAEKPNVNLIECFWEKGGEAAVAIQGCGKVVAQNCAFGPHNVLFHLRGGNNESPSELTLTRCSAFVTRGPAFRLDDSHTCKLDLKYCIFSCPDLPGGIGNREDCPLIRQTESQDQLVAEFKGQRNAYHNLKGVWLKQEETAGTSDPKAELEQFRAKIKSFGGYDNDSNILTSSPWAELNPLQKDLEPKKAFQVTAKLKEARTEDGKKALGIDKCVWGPMAPLPLLVVDAPPPLALQIKPNEKIIDPDFAEDVPPIYRSLPSAFLSAKPGDVFLIKHGKKSREVSLKGLTVDEPNMDVVLKPFPDPNYRPVLVLSTQDKGAAMFRLFDGKLAFENLEFALEPDPQDVKGQTVVALSSNGFCSFKNCVITLKQGERRLPLSAVTLLDLDDVMKMPNTPATSARPQPQITFADSLIRGEGDLINVRSSRPFELKMDNSLAALAGSLVVIQGAGKEMPSEMLMPASVKLTKVTTFLTEPCIVVRGKSMHGVAPTRCEPVRGNLFVMIGKTDRAEKPFLAVEGLDIGVDSIRQYLDWKGDKNAFVNMNAERILEISRPDDATPGSMDSDEFKSKIEPDARFEQQVHLGMPTLRLRPFSQMTFEHYRLGLEYREKLANYGASLDATVLPRFSEPRKVETAGP